jgi:hypothetical protein
MHVLLILGTKKLLYSIRFSLGVIFDVSKIYFFIKYQRYCLQLKFYGRLCLDNF